MKEENHQLKIFNQNPKTTDWKQYLVDLDTYLRLQGFRKYAQGLKNETYAYWKKYDNNKYQIGILVYDWSTYEIHNVPKKVGLQFECMPINIDSRCDLTVCNDIELPEFESMAKDFYEAMSKYIVTEYDNE